MDDLTKEQVDMLQKAFNAFDQEKKGSISTDMIGTIFEMLGHPQTDGNLKQIVAEVDVAGSGQLDFTDFCLLAGKFMLEDEEDAEAMQEALREAFRLYDREGNGYITTAVLREILKELDDKITAEDLDMMIDEIDSDGSGTVDFEAHAFAEWTPESTMNIWELSGLYEGDIMLDGDDDFTRNALISEDRRWPKGVVPYHISKDFDEEEKKTIHKAMEEIEKETCIHFHKYSEKDGDYITFRSDSPGCWSFVGRKGGGQVINLAEKCVRHGVTVHELLHALGLHHQQCAANRDDYVTINWDNIEEDHKHNFQKYNETIVTDYGVEYDYGSIMHYSAYAFSKNERETISPKNKEVKIGQRKEISEKDISKIKIMYKCKKKKKNSGEDYFFSMFGGDLFSY